MVLVLRVSPWLLHPKNITRQNKSNYMEIPDVEILIQDSVNLSGFDEVWTNASNASYIETQLGLRYSLPTTIILCVAYSAVCALGVLGNCVVVAVVRRTPRMRNATNVFIANLACADLLVNVLCLPFTLLSNILSAWVLGAVICKTVPYLQGVSVSASVHTLVAIAVERCISICCPMRAPAMSARSCYYIIAAIWTFSLAVTVPWALFFQLQPLEEGSQLQVCMEVWPTPRIGDVYFVVAHLILCYLAPLAVISVCYTLVWCHVCQRRVPGETQGRKIKRMMHRTRAKAIQMLVVVVASFALSWLPLYALFVWVKLGPPPRTPDQEAFISATLPVAQWLGAANSCVNPVLYAFFNRRFRAGFQTVLAWCCPSQEDIRKKKEQQATTLMLKRRGCVHRRESATALAPQRNGFALRRSRRNNFVLKSFRQDVKQATSL